MIGAMSWEVVFWKSIGKKEKSRYKTGSSNNQTNQLKKMASTILM
jgi:hypothetical protein